MNGPGAVSPVMAKQGQENVDHLLKQIGGEKNLGKDIRVSANAGDIFGMTNAQVAAKKMKTKLGNKGKKDKLLTSGIGGA